MRVAVSSLYKTRCVQCCRSVVLHMNVLYILFIPETMAIYDRLEQRATEVMRCAKLSKNNNNKKCLKLIYGEWSLAIWKWNDRPHVILFCVRILFFFLNSRKKRNKIKIYKFISWDEHDANDFIILGRLNVIVSLRRYHEHVT